MDYERIGAEIGRLVNIKQQQYGDSFGHAGEILRVLYPAGVNPEQYDDLLAITRIIDKLFRIANGNQGEEDAWRDIAGYALLALGREKDD